MSDLVAAAERLTDLVAEKADEAERERRLPTATVEALVTAGLMRMGVPEAYGGPEAEPSTMLRVIETIARADGAAGWCTMIASTTSTQALFLPPAWAKEIYGDPTVVTGGVFAPNGVGVVAADTVTVTGRWPWGSGTQHCQWILGGTVCDDDAFRLCWFDAADVEFHDTWHTSGLRGTGSLDFSVDAVTVPVERTIRPLSTRATIDVPLARFPNFALLAAAVAAVSLGIGRRALDELVALAQGKRPLFSSRTLAQSPFSQIELARAEAVLRSARAFLYDEVDTAWATAVAGDPVDVPARIGIRLAAVEAARRAAQAADTAFTLAGGSSVYSTNVLQRCQRDAHIPTQHLQVAPKLYETLGRGLLGQDVDTAML